MNNRANQAREKVADIPETFNYLLGLHVQTRRVYDDDRRRYLVYRGLIDHRQIVVIWRETEGWQKADLEREKPGRWSQDKSILSCRCELIMPCVKGEIGAKIT